MNLNLPSWVLRRQGGPGVETRNVGAVSRRQFFGATGLVLAAGWSNRLGAHGQNPHVDASPLPIPGGVSPFGVFIHHFPVISNSTPLAALNEPSQITDFNGFVGANRVRGTGSSSVGPLSFQADMGFMDGVYVAKDGKHYQAAFGFI